MRILILCDHFATGGGAGTIARLQAEELSRGHEVHVLAAHLPKNFQIINYQLPITNYDLDYHPKFRNYLGLHHPKAIKILRDYLSKHHFDLAITHNIHWNWSYSALDVLAQHEIKTIHVFHDVSSFTNNTKLCGIIYNKRQTTNDNQTTEGREPSVVSRESSVQYEFNYRYSEFRRLREWWGGVYNPFKQHSIRKHLAKATKTVAVSNALADALRQNNIRADAVVHNGLPPSPTPALGHPSKGGGSHSLLERGGREADGVCLNTDTILFIGKTITIKGILQIVDYLAYLKKQYQFTPRFEIAGASGIGFKKMMTLAHEKNVDTQITIHGWLESNDYKHVLSSCSLVIVPSICFDSFPTVILEAMQYAKPVVATIFGGANEIVDHGSTGYIEDPFDIPAFSRRINELLTDQEKSRRFGTAGFERLRSEFLLEQQTRKLLALV